MNGDDSLGDETTGLENPSSVDVSDVTAVARLSLHVKQNNIAYLIATAVMYQIGVLDKIFAYGTGLC